MSQYWSLSELHDTAKSLYDQATEREGTQKAVIEVINDHREYIGLNRVTRQAVQKAIREGGRSNVRLLCDVVDALWPQIEATERDGGDPVLHVKVA
jgi:hypothetical protein